MTSTIVQTRTKILSLTFDQRPSSLEDLANVLNSLLSLYGDVWRLNVALHATRAGDIGSPALNPVPASAPSPQVIRIAEGSWIVDLAEDAAVRETVGALLGGGGLWMLFRVLRRGPNAIAEFMADVLNMPSTVRSRRSEANAEKYRLQREEIESRMELFDARIREWYAIEGGERIWTSYQRLLNSFAGDLAVRMLDEEGEELTEPAPTEIE
jgi:hypothetical protein